MAVKSPLSFHIGRGLKIARLEHWEIPSPRVFIYLSSTSSCREPALWRHSAVDATGSRKHRPQPGVSFSSLWKQMSKQEIS